MKVVKLKTQTTFKELLDVYNKCKKKVKMLEENLNSGTPVIYNDRELNVFEMVQVKYFLNQITKDIEKQDVQIGFKVKV